MADDATKIEACVQNWLIAHPLILKISNPNDLKLNLVISYKEAEIISRTVGQVVPNSEGIYRLELTKTEHDLIYKLTNSIAEPKVDIILRAYDGINLTYTDSKTVNVIAGNICWVKINNLWKKAIVFIRPNNASWKRGTTWHKNSDDKWSR